MLNKASLGEPGTRPFLYKRISGALKCHLSTSFLARSEHFMLHLIQCAHDVIEVSPLGPIIS